MNAALLPLLVAVGFSVATGWAVIDMIVPSLRGRWPVLFWCLALAVGPAVETAGDLLWTVGFHGTAYAQKGWWLVDTMLLIAALGGWCISRRSRPTPVSPPTARTNPTPVQTRLRRCAAAVVLGCGLWLTFLALVGYTTHRPDGAWDAWTMWNYKARMLYLAPPQVLHMFTDDVLQPAYPLMQSLIIARFWRYAHADVSLIPQAVAVVATLLTACIMAAGVAALRGLVAACIGVLALTSSTFFIKHGASQDADTLVGFYMLASLVTTSLWLEQSGPNGRTERRPGLIVLTGLLAGCAMWTKNEGVLFAVAMGLGLGLAMLMPASAQGDARRDRGGRTFHVMTAFLIGAAGFILLFGAVVTGCALNGLPVRSDFSLVASCSRAIDPARWAAVWRGIHVGVRDTVDKLTIWLLIAAVGTATVSSRRRLRDYRASAVAGAVLAMQFSGCVAVYLLLSNNVNSQIDTSISRVMIQLWPGVVFTFCLLLPNLDNWLQTDRARLTSAAEQHS